MTDDSPAQDAPGPPEGERIELAVLAQGAASELGELEGALTDAGVEARVIPHPDDCAAGCTPRLLLVTLPERAEEARRVLDARWAEEYAGSPEAAVVDLDADEAACPACGTVFQTAAGRCPECGLNVGG